MSIIKKKLFVKLLLLIYIIYKLVNMSLQKPMRIYLLDCGRKYFSLIEMKNLIDWLSENNFNYLELAVGNGGMRFLLDSMTINSLGKTYNSDDVKKLINEGNKIFYDCGENNEWNQNEMDEIIDYALSKKVKIIPLFNSPGHMDSLIYAMEILTGEECSFKNSVETIDITNEISIDFTKQILKLYLKYFRKKNIKYFSIGTDEYGNDLKTLNVCGFQYLINEGKFGYLIKYINEIAKIVRSEKMNVLAFNDPFNYNEQEYGIVDNKKYEFDKNIIISYWFAGNERLKYADAKTLYDKGFKIINTNRGWYYGIGRNFDEVSLQNIKYNDVTGTGVLPVIGCTVCFWTDESWVEFEGEEIENVKKQISYFANANLDIFKK